MTRGTILSAAIALAVSTTAIRPAAAHHSFAMFDSTKLEIIEGTVKEFAWKNPHVVLWVVVPAKDGKPEQLWSVETTSPGNLTRAGWSKNTFNPGDKVKVDIRPLRNGETGGSFMRAVLTDSGKVIETGGSQQYFKPDS